MKNFKKNQNNGINTANIGNQLHQHLVNRAKLEQEQDRLWSQVRRGYSRTSELDKVDKKIGDNTYAIDGLIGKLIAARCRSGKAYGMAVNFLKREIARNQRIISSWEQKIRDVLAGRSCWIDSSGRRHYDCTFAYRYVDKKKRKVAETQRRLSQLL